MLARVRRDELRSDTAVSPEQLSRKRWLALAGEQVAAESWEDEQAVRRRQGWRWPFASALQHRSRFARSARRAPALRRPRARAHRYRPIKRRVARTCSSRGDPDEPDPALAGSRAGGVYA